MTRKSRNLPEQHKITQWTHARDMELCDLIADGATFEAAGNALDTTKCSALGRFQRIAEKYGWQRR